MGPAVLFQHRSQSMVVFCGLVFFVVGGGFLFGVFFGGYFRADFSMTWDPG